MKRNEDNPLVIPFGKAVRVGNYKLWRGNYAIGRAKDKMSVECIYISTVDGSWMTRIPATSAMYSTLTNGYATVDENLRGQFLGMILTNIYNVSTIPSVALHDAFYFLTEMMTYPYLLLSEDEMKRRMKDGLSASGMDEIKADEHISQMVDYRRKLYELIERKRNDFIEEYERQQAESRKKDPDALDDMDADALAEQAMDIINEKGEA